MDAYEFPIYIPYNDFVLSVLLLIFAIVAYLAISNNWKWLQSRPTPIPWLAEHYVAFLLPLGFVAIALAIYFWIWDIRGEIGQIITLLDGKTDPTDIRNLAYAIGALLAAVALSATIPFQLIKVWVNERLAKTTEQGHMTDRITKAVEQLGAEKTIWVEGGQQSVPNLEVRLGAIYALERIAQDSLRDHIPVMKLLCTYIRHNARAKVDEKFDVDYKHENWSAFQRLEIMQIPPPRIDIQAALTAIGERGKSRVKYEQSADVNSAKRKYRLDLRYTNLQKVDLSNLNFDNALLQNSVLRGASLVGIKLQNADLRYSDLRGTDLSYSNIQGADFSSLAPHKLHDANFYNSNTSLTAVHYTALHQTKNLSETQIRSMFGDSTTIIPKQFSKPEWSKITLVQSQFYRKWRAAKAAANL